MKTLDELKIEALASFLEIEPDDLRERDYDHCGLPVFALGNQEYAIGTDDEADKAAREYIEGSVWAFNASFICSHIGLPELEEAIQAYQEKECESSNDSLLALVSKWGFEDFANDAISADGRGHFLSGYDGEESEYSVHSEQEGDETFYIYRIN